MPDRTPHTPFLVFISAKSEDYPFAEELYAFLQQNGIPTFFSKVSLLHLGKSTWGKEIDQALEQAQHLIVVGSRAEYLKHGWVEAEWRAFVNELNSQRKRGNLIIVTVGDLQPKDLPVSLRGYQVIPWNNQVFEAVWAYIRPDKPTPAYHPLLSKPKLSSKKRWPKLLGLLLGAAAALTGIAIGLWWWPRLPPPSLPSEARTKRSVTAMELAGKPAPPSLEPPPASSSSSKAAAPSHDQTSDQGAPALRAQTKPSAKAPAAPAVESTPAQALSADPKPMVSAESPAASRKADLPETSSEAMTTTSDFRAGVFLDATALFTKGSPARTDIYLQQLIQEITLQLRDKGIAVAPQAQPHLPTVKLLPPHNHQIFLTPIRDDNGNHIQHLALQMQVVPAGAGAPAQSLPITGAGRDLYQADALRLAVRQTAANLVAALTPILKKER